MNTHLIYKYNDMAYFITHLNMYGDWGVVCFYRILNNFMSVIAVNNLFIVLNIGLSIYFTYKLFKYLRLCKTVSLSFSLVYSFSLYFIYRVISFTPGLYTIFLFPLLIWLLFKGTNPIIVALFTILSIIFSNYHGYFIFIIVLFWYLYDFFSKRIALGVFIKNTLIYIAVVILVAVLIFFPVIQKNLPLFGNYKRSQTITDSSGFSRVYRPIEDWINLSFRPWYFFIPPNNSLYFGKYSESTYTSMKSTNYYLADDYMEQEMASSFMGWHFLIGMFVIILITSVNHLDLFKRSLANEFYINNKPIILRSLFIIIAVLLMSTPPIVEIMGIRIYTLSYIMYKTIPIFRTLTRWSIVIFFFVLMLNAILVNYYYVKLKSRIIKIILFFLFVFINILVFAIKIPVLNIKNPPQEIAFQYENFPKTVQYAVYPSGDYYSMFWVVLHKDKLINPKDYVGEDGFISNAFTQQLVTENGIEELKRKNAYYFVYYRRRLSDKNIAAISKLNPSITSLYMLDNFYTKHFGIPVYNNDGVYIYIVGRSEN